MYVQGPTLFSYDWGRLFDNAEYNCAGNISGIRCRKRAPCDRCLNIIILPYIFELLYSSIDCSSYFNQESYCNCVSRRLNVAPASTAKLSLITLHFFFGLLGHNYLLRALSDDDLQTWIADIERARDLNLGVLFNSIA